LPPWWLPEDETNISALYPVSASPPGGFRSPFRATGANNYNLRIILGSFRKLIIIMRYIA
jgi:hypothetical protein